MRHQLSVRSNVSKLNMMNQERRPLMAHVTFFKHSLPISQLICPEFDENQLLNYESENSIMTESQAVSAAAESNDDVCSLNKNADGCCYVRGQTIGGSVVECNGGTKIIEEHPCDEESKCAKSNHPNRWKKLGCDIIKHQRIKRLETSVQK